MGMIPGIVVVIGSHLHIMMLLDGHLLLLDASRNTAATSSQGRL